MDRGQPLQKCAHRLRQQLVSQAHVCKQRIATAALRHLRDMKHRPHRRLLVARHVGVPPFTGDELRIFRRPNFQTFIVAFALGLQRVDVQSPEAPAEPLVILRRQRLIAEHQNLMIKERAVDLAKSGVVQLPREINTLDLRADRGRDRMNGNMPIGLDIAHDAGFDGLETLAMHDALSRVFVEFRQSLANWLVRELTSRDILFAIGDMARNVYCRSAALTGYAELARALGLDPLRLAAAAGVPAAALIDPDLKISPTAVGRMLEGAAGRSAAHDFGLRLAEKRRLSNMGAVALIAREQPTLRKALQVMAQFQWLQNEAVSLTIEEVEDVAVLKVTTAGARRRNARQAVELSIGVLCRNIRELVGRNWRPELVYFTHAAPASLAAHRRVLGVKPLFDQPFDGIAFARETLDAPLPDADPEFARQAARYVEQIAAGQRTLSARHRIEELIALLLPTGTCSIKKAALHLGIDRRTIHRHLKAEATTFQALVEQTRRRLATRFLADRPVRDVAEALGFASASAFSRWFHQRHGRTARSFKSQLSGQLPPTQL